MVKLITPRMLNAMRRGAEHLHKKHRETLATQYTTVNKAIAKELGLTVKDFKPDPLTAKPNKAKIFDDAPEQVDETPVELARVKLTDYITALQNFKIDPVAENSGSQSGSGSKKKAEK